MNKLLVSIAFIFAFILPIGSPAFLQTLEQSSQSLLLTAAKSQIGRTMRYNPAYQTLTYPHGDVPIEEGVCTDVIIRAFREIGIDLQKLVHEDMKKNWARYPKLWSLSKPDPNIDHRRVANLVCYFDAQKMRLADKAYQGGDMVIWDLGNGILHIGMLSNQMSEGHPLVIHNICCGVKEEDILTSYKIVAHFRINK